MCGIAGQARSDGQPVDERLVHRMCAAIEHRGPDSRGVHAHGPVGLGIQRLRVIDLHTGDQPLFNEDGTVVVVLNGEIYNYRELRSELIRRGHRFRSQGDTEVIAHLYEEKGPACVSSLHGMFAFALWDSRRRQLLIARDRVGKKPLFYACNGRTLSFASELGALMQDGDIPRELDPQALDCYFHLTYIPAPLSAFKAVRKLPPASMLLFRDGELSTERYWRLDYRSKLGVRNVEEAGEIVRDGIRAAVRRRLISDVPLGAFLSGGVDSSAVVAAMAEASSQPVKTFSIGFESDSHNELPHARYVAERFSTDHHEFVVRPDAVEMLPRIVRHYGEPFADHSAIPSFCLAEMTRRHVTVALNGDGGDESFGGYERYVTQALLERLEVVPGALRAALGAMGARVRPGGEVTSARSRLRRVAQALPQDAAGRYLMSVLRSGSVRLDGYTDDFRHAIDEAVTDEVIRGPWRESSASGIVDRMLDVDVNTYLPGDLLVKMDIATMAHSLEARSPLIDHEFMELAASLPQELKVSGRGKKVALRAAARGWLPGEFLDRPKQGFQVPMADWFRGELQDMARDVLLDPAAGGSRYFRREWVAGLLDRHAAAAEDNSSLLWSLLVFEVWHQQVSGGAARGPEEAARAA
jgi:asparagine synthase (glutamine-hydrolysing)